MRIVVTGGGTGGHIYPALAVAEALRAANQAEEIVYIGKTSGLEAELVAHAGLEFHGIEFSGMPRGLNPMLPFKLLAWGWQLQQAVSKARVLLREIKPQIVFGTGGYVSAPVLMAAHSLKIPYGVHEPDAHPGLVNRLMGRNASAITTSFTQGAERLKHTPRQEVRVTGNPIRGDIGQLGRAEALKKLGLDWPENARILLVTGGSQGARRINTAVAEALPALVDELGLYVIHQTGKKLYDETMASLAPAFKQHPRYKVAPYYSDMAPLLAVAGLALCRAGSLSLSEMYVCGIPTVLVPYPFAAADHQRKNAEASVQSGASLMIEDEALTATRLLEVLRPLTAKPEQLQAMAASAKALAHPNATQEIIACLKAHAKTD